MLASDPNRGGQKTVGEVPVDAIREAAKHVPEILIRVKRRNARGQLANVAGMSGIRKPTLDLLDIETWVGDTLGGGNFRIEVASATNPMEEPPIPPFAFEVEGPPKMHSAVDMGLGYGGGGNGIPGFRMPQQITSPMSPAAPVAASPYGGQLPMPPAAAYAAQQNGGVLPPMPGLTGFNAGLPPAMQWNAFGWNDQTNPTAPGASMSSDQVALMSANQLREDNLKLKQEMDAVRSSIESVHDEYRKELLKRDEEVRKLHEQQKEREHKLELQLLEKKFEALAAQNAPKQADTMSQMVPLITAMTPVFAAMVQANAQTAQRQTEMQLQMLQAQQKRPSQDWAPLLAASAPIIMKFMENRGPEAQSAVWETMMQNNMQSLSLIGQFMAETAKGSSEQSPWLPLIQAAMEGGMSTLAAYMESKTQQRPPQQPMMTAGGHTRALGAAPQQQEYAPQPAPAQQPMQAAPRQPQQSAPTVSYTTQSSAPGQQSYQKVALDANGIVRQVMASSMVPADFKTQEWGIIIGAIHRQEDPALIADALLDLMEALTVADKIPSLLAAAWTDPLQSYGTLLGGLPIGQANPAYCSILLDLLAERTAERLAAYEAAQAQEAAAGVSPDGDGSTEVTGDVTPQEAGIEEPLRGEVVGEVVAA